MFTPQLPSDAQWHNAIVARSMVPQRQRHWLFDSQSLTDKLVVASANQFRVEVLSQRIHQPLFSESQILNLAHQQYALLREVVLLGNGVPWVYARTVIPLSSLQGNLKRLRYLGNRSLGSALFADPHLRREVLQIAPIEASYLPACEWLHNTQPTWGRRSVFNLQGKPLLVTEVFLESLWNNGLSLNDKCQTPNAP